MSQAASLPFPTRSEIGCFSYIASAASVFIDYCDNYYLLTYAGTHDFDDCIDDCITMLHKLANYVLHCKRSMRSALVWSQFQ